LGYSGASNVPTYSAAVPQTQQQPAPVVSAYPTSNLQPGQTSPEVAKLQQFLISQGYSIPDGATGFYGPQTKAAVTKWQQQKGVQAGNDFGYWGPKSIAAATGTGTAPATGQYTDEQYAAALNANPIIQTAIKKGNTIEDLTYAAESGDISGLVNEFGQPFSLADQQEALRKAEEDNKAFYAAEKQKEQTATESALAQKQADYQNYLLTSGQNFEKDKATADQTAADRGVLFSGGRVQKEKMLQNAYQTDQAYKQASVGGDIAGIAQDYQYKYGNDAANSLSKYYQLGGNTYNANVASGGVGSSGLSSIYNPSQTNYYGTKNTEQKAAANQRAAGLLWNKGNKLLATGYSNQY
jgi:hypothetical protein